MILGALDPMFAPGKQGFGHVCEIYRTAVLQVQEGVQNTPLLRGNRLAQIGLVPKISAGFLEYDGLHHEGCSFVQSFQNVLAVIVENVMDTTMIEVADTELDGPVYCRSVNALQHFVQAAHNGSGVMVELEQVGSISVQDLLLAGKENAK